MIRAFTNGVLITIDNDKYFIREDTIVEEVKKLSDDVIQAIKNKEANSVTDASAKNDHVAVAWIIEDECKINRCQSEL